MHAHVVEWLSGLQSRKQLHKLSVDSPAVHEDNSSREARAYVILGRSVERAYVNGAGIDDEASDRLHIEIIRTLESHVIRHLIVKLVATLVAAISFVCIKNNCSVATRGGASSLHEYRDYVRLCTNSLLFRYQAIDVSHVTYIDSLFHQAQHLLVALERFE